MNLYLIYHNLRQYGGYDTYDSAVVAAPDEMTARRLHPGNHSYNRAMDTWGFTNSRTGDFTADRFGSWVKNPGEVELKLIGTAVEGTETGVVLASFNAG